MLLFLGRISPILGGFFIVLMGVSLLATTLGLSASAEGFSESTIGLIMSAYFSGFVVGSFACPVLIRRIGHIRTFTLLAAAAAVAAYSHGLWVYPSVWFLLRLLTGICVIGLYLVVESWINSIVPYPMRGSVFAIYMTLTLLAVSLGPYMILFVEKFVLGMVAMLLCLGMLPIALTRIVEPNMRMSLGLDIKKLYQVSPIGLVGASIAGLVNSAYFSLGAVFADRIGMSPSQIAMFMSILVFGGALMQWPVGRISDLLERRSVLAVVSLLAALFAIVAYLFIDVSYSLMLLLMFFYGGMSFTIYPLSVAHLNDRLQQDEILEATQGVLLLYGIGAICGPLLAGLIMDGLGVRSLLLFFATGYLLLGGYAIYRKGQSEPVAADAKSRFVPMTRTSQAALPMHPEVDGQKSPSE